MSNIKRLALAGTFAVATPILVAQQASPSNDSAFGVAACGGCWIFLFMLLACIVLNIALLVWVARDAKARGMDSSVLWMLLVFFTSVLGLAIYLFSRPKGNVPKLRQRQATGCHEVPALWLRIMKMRSGRTLALVIFIVMVALGVDSARIPERRLSVYAFKAGVALYLRDIHPVTSRYIRYRYTPSCSHYAEDTITRSEIRKGSVPFGTQDPVPIDSSTRQQ